MFENLISALKAEKRTIVFTEGEDARIPVSYTHLTLPTTRSV